MRSVSLPVSGRSFPMRILDGNPIKLETPLGRGSMKGVEA